MNEFNPVKHIMELEIIGFSMVMLSIVMFVLLASSQIRNKNREERERG